MFGGIPWSWAGQVPSEPHEVLIVRLREQPRSSVLVTKLADVRLSRGLEPADATVRFVKTAEVKLDAKANNAVTLPAKTDVDGTLVRGASLDTAAVGATVTAAGRLALGGSPLVNAGAQARPRTAMNRTPRWLTAPRCCYLQGKDHGRATRLQYRRLQETQASQGMGLAVSGRSKEPPQILLETA